MLPHYILQIKETAEIINEFTHIISIREKKIVFRLLKVTSNEENIHNYALYYLQLDEIFQIHAFQ